MSFSTYPKYKIYKIFTKSSKILNYCINSGPTYGVDTRKLHRIIVIFFLHAYVKKICCSSLTVFVWWRFVFFCFYQKELFRVFELDGVCLQILSYLFFLSSSLRKNFRFPEFDRFTCFEIYWTRFDYFF